MGETGSHQQKGVWLNVGLMSASNYLRGNEQNDPAEGPFEWRIFRKRSFENWRAADGRMRMERQK